MTMIETNNDVAVEAGKVEGVDVAEMRVNVDGYEMLRAMKRVSPLCARAGWTGTPALKMVRLDADGDGVFLTATNLEVTLRVEVPGAVSDRVGSVLLPPALTQKFLPTKKSGSERVTVECLGASDVVMRRGARERRLVSAPVNEWPLMPVIEGTCSAVLDTDLLRHVMPSISPDAARPILQSVFFTEDRMVSTDSYRLHEVQGAPYVGDGFLIPLAGVTFMEKIGGLALAEWDERARDVRMSFETGETLTVRTVEGDFPDYRKLFPAWLGQEIRLDWGAAVEATVAHMKGGLVGDKVPVKLSAASGGGVSFEVSVHGVGDEAIVVPGVFPEDLDAIGFNPAYLLDFLGGPGDGEVVLRRDGDTQGLKPATVTERFEEASGSVTVRRLIMPIRIS